MTNIRRKEERLYSCHLERNLTYRLWDPKYHNHNVAMSHTLKNTDHWMKKVLLWSANHLFTGLRRFRSCSAFLMAVETSSLAFNPAQWVLLFHASVLQPWGACFSIHLKRSERSTPAASRLSYEHLQVIDDGRIVNL